MTQSLDGFGFLRAEKAECNAADVRVDDLRNTNVPLTFTTKARVDWKRRAIAAEYLLSDARRMAWIGVAVGVIGGMAAAWGMTR